MSEYYPPENPGGAGKLAATYFSALARRGHEIVLFCPTALDSRSEWVEGVKVHRLKTKISASSSNSLLVDASATFTRDIEVREGIAQFDLIHDMGGFLFSEVTAYLALRYKRPLITHFLLLMGPYAAAEQMPREMIQRFAERQKKSAHLSDAIILTSSSERSLAALWLGEPVKRSFLIPNCIELTPTKKERYKGYSQKSISFENRAGVLTGGRLFSHAKGFDITMGALAHLLKTSSRFCLIIIGELGKNRKLLESLPVSSYRVLGWIDDAEVTRLQLCCDYVIQTPRYEAFGLLVLESMAAGCIPLVLNVGGLRDIVKNGSSGIIAETFRPEYLSHQLYQTEIDKQRKDRLRTSAIRRASEFGSSEAAAQVEKVYTQVLSCR